MDQRRSQRQACALSVEVTAGRRRIAAVTRDVSLHGVFIETVTPLKERFLLQLSIDLPGGPLDATGFVVRRVDAGHTANERGVGVQFYALTPLAKTRWERFIRNLLGHTPSPNLAWSRPERALFLVKLRDRARLQAFADQNLATGALYLTTPALKEEGSQIALAVVHPDSGEEYVIDGSVVRVRREVPKGMEVHLETHDASAQTEFRDFMNTGRSSRPNRLPVPPPLVAPPTGDNSDSSDLSIEIDVDEEAMAPPSAASLSRQLPALDPTTDDLLDRANESRDLEEASAALLSMDGRETIEVPLPLELLERLKVKESARLSRDAQYMELDVNLGSAPTESTRAEEPEVRTDPPVADWQLEFLEPVAYEELSPTDVLAIEPPPRADETTDRADAGAPEPLPLLPQLTGPNSTETASPAGVQETPTSESSEGREIPPTLDPIEPSPEDEAIRAPDRRPSAALRTSVSPVEALVAGHASLARLLTVRCAACGASHGPLRVGAAEGSMGLVAEFKPHWNPENQRLVSVLRMRGTDERTRIREALDALTVSVPAAMLFEVAELTRPPVDPESGARVRVNGLVKALLKASKGWECGVPCALPSATCPSCKGGPLEASVEDVLPG